MNTLHVLAFVLLAVYVSADNCSPNPCLNNGICSIDKGSVQCACVPGYAGSICQSETCSKAPNCKSCPGDQLPCVECHELYGLNFQAPFPRCKLCSDFKGCNECDNTTICTRCVDIEKYGPDFNGEATCSRCGANCRSCKINGGGKCDICADGTPAVDGLCECAEHCTDCTNFGWSLCDSGKCETGYGIIPGSKCGKCPDNCAVCLGSPPRCNKCVSDKYHLKNGVCTLSGDL